MNLSPPTTELPELDPANPLTVNEIMSMDQTLNEIRSGRRLEKIVASIESFLNSQVVRLNSALEQCNRAVENDRIVRQILADFETEKQEWEANRESELARLQKAGEELIAGWEKLESERRKWLDERQD